nr:MAG TPA: hypothetical protein [Caudoviricetes sp.]
MKNRVNLSNERIYRRKRGYLSDHGGVWFCKS